MLKLGTIRHGLEQIEENYSMELLYARLGELQLEMKTPVAGAADENEHFALGLT